jgi:hypothetical protein
MWQGERTAKLLGFCCDAIQVCVLLGCSATSLGDWSKCPIRLDILIYEFETTTLSRVIGQQSPTDVVSHPTRTETLEYNLVQTHGNRAQECVSIK